MIEIDDEKKSSHYHAFELTEKGMNLRQRAIASGKDGNRVCIEFTRGCIGTGRPPSDGDIFLMDSLVEPALDVLIKENYAENANHIMSIIIDNTDLTEDLLMTEIGIFARLIDSSGSEIVSEILYGYTFTDKYDYLPIAKNYFMHREISFNTVLSRNGNFTIVFDGSHVYASAEDLREFKEYILSLLENMKEATQTESGYMSAFDKEKLDSIEYGADRSGVIIQIEIPEGNPNKIWVNPETSIAYYWHLEDWVPIAGTVQI